MSMNQFCEREFDFALILSGASELTDELLNALFEAGCDDATVSLQYGKVYMEFSRTAVSLKDAILSAIRDVERVGKGVRVCRVDECNLVTQAEIARRIDKSRQHVHQFINGQRGPGGFPAPVCHITDGAPMWAWCAVSYWLLENDMIRPEVLQDAEVIAAINNALEAREYRERNSKLADEVRQFVETPESYRSGCCGQN